MMVTPCSLIYTLKAFFEAGTQQTKTHHRIVEAELLERLPRVQSPLWHFHFQHALNKQVTLFKKKMECECNPADVKGLCHDHMSSSELSDQQQACLQKSTYFKPPLH